MDDISKEKIKDCKDEEIDVFFKKLQGLELTINADVDTIKCHYENEYKKVNSQLVEYFKNDDIKNKYENFKTNIDSFDKLDKINDLSKSCTNFFAAINAAINNKNISNNTNISNKKNDIKRFKYEDETRIYVKNVIDFSTTKKDYSTLESKIELSSSNEYLTNLDNDIKEFENEYKNNENNLNKELDKIRNNLIDIYGDILDVKSFDYKGEMSILYFINFMVSLKVSVDNYKKNLHNLYVFTKEELIFSLPIYQCFDNNIKEENLNIEYKNEDFYPDKFKSNVLENEKYGKYVIKKVDDLEVYKDIFKFINNIFKYGDYKFCKEKDLKKYTEKPCSDNHYGNFYILKFDYYYNNDKCLDELKESLKDYNNLMQNKEIKNKLLQLIDDFINIFNDLIFYSQETDYKSYRNGTTSEEFKVTISKNLKITQEILILLKQLLNTNLLNGKIIDEIKKNISILKNCQSIGVKENKVNFGELMLDFKFNEFYTFIITRGYFYSIFSKSLLSYKQNICNSIEAFKFYNDTINKLYQIKDSVDRKQKFKNFVEEQVKYMKKNYNKAQGYIKYYVDTYSDFITKHIYSSIINCDENFFQGDNYDMKEDTEEFYKKFDCYENCENYKKNFDSAIEKNKTNYDSIFSMDYDPENTYGNIFKPDYVKFPIESLATFIKFFEDEEKKGKKSTK